MTATLTERLVNRVAKRTDRQEEHSGPPRRGFLGGAALLGAALAVDPWGYLTRPASAYDAVCGADNTCEAGYTVFCCTINGGRNSCPPDSFIGGWWKADNASFCGGSARYYIDCNAYRDGRYTCHCNQSTCDQRRVACNQFRYGQCSTQIPWSNTGPVLCRVVSCTPPWVQFGGTCSSSSATDNNTVTHSAPCVAGQLPVGSVDSITSSGNTVHIRGWAYDPDQPSTSIQVAIYQDGKRLSLVTADHVRADIDAAHHISGNHGFELSLTASNGPHAFKVYAINVGSGSSNPLIGSRSFTVNPGSAPIGHLDSITTSGNKVTITGWAYDRDKPTESLGIVVYQDGERILSAPSTITRGDVNSAYHITGAHGFTISLTATAGTHTYRVYALNVGGGVGNPLLGARSVAVRAAAVAPSGKLESVSASGNTVRLRGWVYDPDNPAAEIAVAVYEDGHGLHWYPTGVSRPDVETGYGVKGKHGFDITLTAGKGVHTFTVHPMGLGGGTSELALGSKTVAVDQTGPIGRVEDVQVLGNTVKLTGWAADPDQPAAAVAVTVFEDGAALSRHTTEGSEGQFEITLQRSPGPHTYTVYAANPDAPDSMIGGATVTVGDDVRALPAGTATAGPR